MMRWHTMEEFFVHPYRAVAHEFPSPGAEQRMRLVPDRFPLYTAVPGPLHNLLSCPLEFHGPKMSQGRGERMMDGSKGSLTQFHN